MAAHDKPKNWAKRYPTIYHLRGHVLVYARVRCYGSTMHWERLPDKTWRRHVWFVYLSVECFRVRVTFATCSTSLCEHEVFQVNDLPQLSVSRKTNQTQGGARKQLTGKDSIQNRYQGS